MWLNVSLALTTIVLVVFALRSLRDIRRDLEHFTEALSFERSQAEALKTRVVVLESSLHGRPSGFLDTP